MFSGGTQAVISRNHPFSIKNESLVPLLDIGEEIPECFGNINNSWEEGGKPWETEGLNFV